MNFSVKTASTILVVSTSLAWCESSFEFSQLPPLPDREGVAGAFAGVSGGCLIVAGGANFPDKKPWEHGKKVWYDTVYVLDTVDGVWRIAGKLPIPLGYGVSVTTSDGFVCIGGSDAEKHHTEVFRMSLKGGEIHFENLPSLPIPLANCAGALLEDTVYVFGGSDEPGDKLALNRLFALDLKSASSRWKEYQPCPGKGRILPVAAALDGAFYVAGGAALESVNGKIARVYLRDTDCFRPGVGWKHVADMPQPAVAAPSPAPTANLKFFILGGDDGSRVGFQPPEKHPGFSKSVLTYDVRCNAWNTSEGLPFSRAVLPAAHWEGRWVLPSGEARPGVRSPEVWAFTPSR